VPEHEICWVPNPHSRAGGDNLQLLEIVPGHYHFEASFFATNLCKMVGTNPRSQFYKTPATGESRPTSRRPYSWGNGRTIKRQEFYASRRQARAIEEKEQTATTSLRDNVTAPSPNQKQGRPVTNLGVPFVSQGPNLTEMEATLYDNNLFYRNGNPKPTTNLTARRLTSKARKRQGGRKRNRRRNRRGRPSDEVSKEPNPTTTERTQGADEPTQTGSDAIPPSPCQHMGTILSLPPAEPKIEDGAACFGPNTALLIQDPLNWAAHVLVDKLTRPIGSLKKGDTVLAEKHGKFFLARVKCVMTFEIPQAIDPTANRIIQDNTLSTGLGFTLTRHHHILNYGQIHCNTQGKWQLSNQADNMQWMVAADLSRYPTRTRQPHTFPVTRVFNLALDPPGNVVILTPSHKAYISASLGYHMRYGKDPDDRIEQTGGIPVYTRGDALQLQGLPEFGRGLIQWGQGAVTRANDGRLTFDRHKIIRRGHNLFLDQPLETLSNIIETLPATENNMWRLQKWRQVCKDGNSTSTHIRDPRATGNAILGLSSRIYGCPYTDGQLPWYGMKTSNQ